MKPIESFQVDHTRLKPGLYVSRVDKVGPETITTYDIRMKRPNSDPPMSTAVMHTIEHLGATFLRRFTDAPVLYFGPMGCRTGFYLILGSAPDLLWTLELVERLMDFVLRMDEVPGASEKECGNADDHDLHGAKAEALLYLSTVLDGIRTEADPRLHYPAQE